MNRLPRIVDLDAGSTGWGFYLCARKELRSGRGGDYLALLLRDSSGQAEAKILEDVDSFGSPVEPMTVEAFILPSVDDLDAKIHQVRRHVAEDEGDGEFTGYHRRLNRVLFKPSGR